MHRHKWHRHDQCFFNEIQGAKRILLELPDVAPRQQRAPGRRLLDAPSRPLDAIRERIQEDFILEGSIGVAVGRSEDASFAVLICPEHRMFVA